jgi:uncharacterized protein YbaR (Trm112 family)
MEIIRCPVCKAELDLDVEKEEGDEIIEGTLACTVCGHPYRIEDGIPDLLPPESR